MKATECDTQNNALTTTTQKAHGQEIDMFGIFPEDTDLDDCDVGAPALTAGSWDEAFCLRPMGYRIAVAIYDGEKKDGGEQDNYWWEWA